MPLMPECNAYGLQGTEFLDPLPVPWATVRGRVIAEPPYRDFSPDEPGVFDAEDEEEEGPTEQGRTRLSVSPKERGRRPRDMRTLG